ncbi:MAG: hypothetical protein ACE3JK_13725 [Sporolactobacillus sp.]
MAYDNLEIVFENVESIIIPAVRILNLQYEKAKISEDNYDKGRTFKAEKLDLVIGLNDISEIAYNADHAENPLGMFTGNPDSNWVADRPNILGRILYHNDITWIQEADSNGKVINSYSVPRSDDDFTNHLMRTYITRITGQYNLALEVHIGRID